MFSPIKTLFRKLTGSGFTIAAIILSGHSLAGTVVCSGTVSVLSYHSPNMLMLRLSSMNAAVFICSPDNTWTVSGTAHTTGPETCKTIYSTFLAAKASGKTVSSVYFDGDDVPGACDGWGNWKSANIRYYELY